MPWNSNLWNSKAEKEKFPEQKNTDLEILSESTIQISFIFRDITFGALNFRSFQYFELQTRPFCVVFVFVVSEREVCDGWRKDTNVRVWNLKRYDKTFWNLLKILESRQHQSVR